MESIYDIMERTGVLGQWYIHKTILDSDGESEPIYGIQDEFIEAINAICYKRDNLLPVLVPFSSKKGSISVYLKCENGVHRFVRQSSGEFSESKVAACVRFFRPLESDSKEAGE